MFGLAGALFVGATLLRRIMRTIATGDFMDGIVWRQSPKHLSQHRQPDGRAISCPSFRLPRA